MDDSTDKAYLGVPVILPKGSFEQSKDPGEWYDCVKDLVFHFNNQGLAQLSKMAPHREILLRNRYRWNACEFEKLLHEEVHVCAAMVYMVGEVMEPGCRRCSHIPPRGPFAACVAVPGVFRGACANCIWDEAECQRGKGSWRYGLRGVVLTCSLYSRCPIDTQRCTSSHHFSWG